jgi:organic radical activating enzyme
MSGSERDYYCSYKFKYLKIDLESKTTYNCHAAAPHPINLAWLKNNPGNLFNTDTSINERQQMLDNQRNASCEQNCWRAEDYGAQSPRLYQGGKKKTHSQLITYPEIIDLTVGGDCNLTCSYCCKEFSSAWRRDIVNNGSYTISDSDERFCATDKDRLLLKISQSELKSTQHYQTLLDEIRLNLSNLKKLTVTGGEPLLDNQLIDVLASLEMPPIVKVEIYTGLGVSQGRFRSFIDKLSKLKNLLLIVSAEGIGQHLEFNRYGNKWNEFDAKIKLLEQSEIQFQFQSQLSNLTVFGYPEFVKYFSQHLVNLTFVYQPHMMAPHVLDSDSKQQIQNSILNLPEHMQIAIKKSIQKEPTEVERINLQKFLIEFVRRRPDLDLNIFPESFLKWVELKHVV